MAQRHRNPVSGVFSPDDLKVLLNNLTPVASKWEPIGISLNITGDEIERIKVKCLNDSKACLRELLKEVLRKAILEKKAVIEALESPTVGEFAFAQSLRDNMYDNQDGAGSTNQAQDETEVNLLDLVPRITVNVFPYNFLLGHKYYGVDSVKFVFFICVQIIVLLDDRVLRAENTTNCEGEFINQVVFCLLRVFFTIVTPIVCYVQFRTLTTTLNNRAVLNINDLPENVQQVLKKRKLSLSSSFRTFRSVLSFKCIKLNQVLIHAFVLSLFLYCFGIFHSTYSPTSESPRVESFRHKLQWYGIQLFEVWDCFAVFIILLLSGTLKDLYCLENQLATVLPHNTLIFNRIRTRWMLIDRYLFLYSFVLTFMTLIVLCFGMPFTPSSFILSPEKQRDFNMLAAAITIVQVAGSSPSPTFKTGSVIMYCAIYIVAFLPYSFVFTLISICPQEALYSYYIPHSL